MTTDPGKASSTTDSGSSISTGYPSYPQPILRQAEGTVDMALLYEWRQSSGAPVPTWEEHVAWFDEEFPAFDNRRVILMIDDMGDRSVGTVRVEGRDREVSITIAPAYRGRGIATAALRALRESTPGPLVARIAPDNEPSLRAFRKAGWRTNWIMLVSE